MNATWKRHARYKDDFTFRDLVLIRMSSSNGMLA